MTNSQSTTWFSATTIALLAIGLFANTAKSEVPDHGGQIEAKIDGRTFQFPVLKTDITANIQGDLATIIVKQTFANPTEVPLNASYLFPLNKNAAVYAMKMEVGNEIVTAQIKEKEEAKAQFMAAKKAGKAAALLTQHRPNMFTQELANLMPGLPVTITLKYTQVVPRVDDAYELVVPLIVGPRYQPGPQDRNATIARISPPRDNPDEPEPAVHEENSLSPESQDQAASAANGQWTIQKLPAYPDVNGLTIPDMIDKDRVVIAINLSTALQLGDITSATHAINISGENASRRITLSKERTIDNRDFVLRYKMSKDITSTGLLTHKDRRGGFFSLMIEPPNAPADKDIMARELVFVLDTSGSMSGKPMNASKFFMSQALQMMSSKDYFRIIRFGNDASEFSNGAVPATHANIRAGIAFVDSLNASGGTEYVNAIKRAFSIAPKPNTIRIVVFLSDGYIGNEAQVLNLIASMIGDTRIYAFGVGTSVNRYLMSEMARRGRGFARYIDPTETSRDAAMALAHRIKAPVLTDIKIDWGTLNPDGVTPRIIPDLFAGDSIRLQGRFAQSGKYVIAVEGLVNGHKARLPLTIELPKQDSSGESAAIPLVWARSRIADAMRRYITPLQLRENGDSNDDIKKQVVKLGLDFSLLTRWTSFIAVSTTIVNANPENARNSAVPLPMVKGVSKKAYPLKKQAMFKTNSGQKFAFNFNGNSTPEPNIIGGMLVLTLAGLFARYRRRRRYAAL